MDIRKEFAQRLKQLRIEKQMRQVELCEKVGISPVAMSYYESGERFPKTETLIKIAAALNVKVKDLLGKDLEELSADESPDRISFQLIHEARREDRRLAFMNRSERIYNRDFVAKRAVRNIVSQPYAIEFIKNLYNFLEFDKKEGETPNIITFENKIEPMSREDYFDYLYSKLQKSLLELKTNYDENRNTIKEE